MLTRCSWHTHGNVVLVYATAGPPDCSEPTVKQYRGLVRMEGWLVLMHIQAAGIMATRPLLHAAASCHSLAIQQESASPSSTNDMQKSKSNCKNVALQVSGPHHVSAMEAFPAAAGVADRSAGPDGVRSPGPQAGYGATTVPSPAFSPLNMAGPGKRRLPWAGRCRHCKLCS